MRLLKLKQEDRLAVKHLDKEIKRTSKHKRRRLREKLADGRESAAPSFETQFVKRPLNLEVTKEVPPAKVDPDEFTTFMNSLQPSSDTTSAVQILKFDPPVSLKASLLAAMTMKLKTKCRQYRTKSEPKFSRSHRTSS